MAINRESIVSYLKNKIEDESILYQKRLNWEIAEIDAKEKWDYFINLYLYKKKFDTNKNNLLVPYLLGIVIDFDINKNPECYFGEFPDIDVDYIGTVRDYLKNEWANWRQMANSIRASF